LTAEFIKHATLYNTQITKQLLYILQAMFRSNRGTVSGYFLAGRSMLWLPVSTVYSKIFRPSIFRVMFGDWCPKGL